MLKAHNVDQEYWLLFRTKCECGRFYEKEDLQIQAVRPGKRASYDDFAMRCTACGRETTVRIDISPFFGKRNPDKLSEVLADKKKLQKLFLSASVPMDFLIGYLNELVEAKDLPALEYIERLCLSRIIGLSAEQEN